MPSPSTKIHSAGAPSGHTNAPSGLLSDKGWTRKSFSFPSQYSQAITHHPVFYRLSSNLVIRLGTLGISQQSQPCLPPGIHPTMPSKRVFHALLPFRIYLCQRAYRGVFLSNTYRARILPVVDIQLRSGHIQFYGYVIPLRITLHDGGETACKLFCFWL